MTSQKHTRITAVFLAAVAALVLAACTSNQSGSTPTAPSAPDPNSPQVKSNGQWALTETVVSVTGASRCVSSPPSQGSTFAAYRTGVLRTPLLVYFSLDQGVDIINGGNDFIAGIDGTMTGDAFTAAGRLETIIGCSDFSDATVTGTFSSDGLHLTAREVEIDHEPDGDVTYTLNWTADRQ